MTGDDLINAAGKELNDDALIVSGADVAVSQRALNDTLRDFLNRHPFSWRVVDPPTAVSAVVNQTVYSIAGIQDIVSIHLDTGASDTVPMDEITLREYIQRWANVDFIAAGNPIEYARVDRTKFKVAPRPNSTALTFRVFTVQEFADITVFTAAVTAVPDRALELVKIGMLARLYRHLHEFEKATALYALYENQIGRLINEDKVMPALTYVMKEARPGFQPFATEFWKNPFVRRV